MYFSDEMTAAPTKLFATGVSKRRQMEKIFYHLDWGNQILKHQTILLMK